MGCPFGTPLTTQWASAAPQTGPPVGVASPRSSASSTRERPGRPARKGNGARPREPSSARGRERRIEGSYATARGGGLGGRVVRHTACRSAPSAARPRARRTGRSVVTGSAGSGRPTSPVVALEGASVPRMAQEQSVFASPPPAAWWWPLHIGQPTLSLQRQSQSGSSGAQNPTGDAVPSARTSNAAVARPETIVGGYSRTPLLPSLPRSHDRAFAAMTEADARRRPEPRRPAARVRGLHLRATADAHPRRAAAGATPTTGATGLGRCTPPPPTTGCSSRSTAAAGARPGERSAPFASSATRRRSTGATSRRCRRSSRGVTCFFCRSVDAVPGPHNSPLHLATDGVLRGA